MTRSGWRAWWAMALLLCLMAGGVVWAGERRIRSRVLRIDHAPVAAKDPQASLIEFMGPPESMVGTTSTRRQSGVRYANRKGIWPSRYALQGKVMCRNMSRQTIEAISLTTILLDPFNRTQRAAATSGQYQLHSVIERFPRGVWKRIEWEIVDSPAEVYEVVVLVTGVRFENGTVWTVPQSEVAQLLF